MKQYRVRVSFPRGGSTYLLEASSLDDVRTLTFFWRSVTVTLVKP